MEEGYSGLLSLHENCLREKLLSKWKNGGLGREREAEEKETQTSDPVTPGKEAIS